MIFNEFWSLRFIGDFLFFNCSVLSIREALKKVTEIIMKRFNCVSSRISCSNATYFSVVASILLTITLVSPLVDQNIYYIYISYNKCYFTNLSFISKLFNMLWCYATEKDRYQSEISFWVSNMFKSLDWIKILIDRNMLNIIMMVMITVSSNLSQHLHC